MSSGSGLLDWTREVGRSALVEDDEFVRFRACEAAAPAQEVFEAVPLRAVGGDEDVEVHGRLLLQARVRTGPYYCGALAVSLADCARLGQRRSAKGGAR